MPSTNTHVSICVCTYKRPDCLRRLLDALDTQDTCGLFTYSVVVVDNDDKRSGETVVGQFIAASSLAVRYCVEPRQNIALARNKAIENADGDLVAFIDDDEFPIKQWLLILFRTYHEYHVDGVLGPVKPHFDEAPPTWVVKGKFYDRPTYPTGFIIDWRKGRTGNVLLNRRILTLPDQLFRPEFRTGEDQDFFRRMIGKGHVFVWCDEAVAYEVVPDMRWKRSVMLRRALLRGATSVLHPTSGKKEIVKSAIAVPLYMAALPLTLVLGQDKLMLLLVKLFDHIGRLLAVAGIDPVKEPYVTE